jgi:hypothetical protein
MAYENIRLVQPNFCLGPQSGTICTIDTTNPQTVLRVKSLAGANIIDLSLSSNILNENIRLEYVGPSNISEIRDDLTFFTFEKVSNSICMIKRWITRLAYRELLLKEEIVKYTSGNEYYNAIDFAVEYYHRKFTRPNEYYNYLDMDNVENIKTGTRLFIGPSTDTTNVGATEAATVSHVINYINGKRVFLTAPLKYQYASNDIITLYSYVYVYSSEGYANDPIKGTLFKLDAYTWNTVEIDTKAIYKRVTASRWCPMVGSIASIIGPNLLFVKPYDSYLNWQSLFMNNIESNNNDIFPVRDVIFDNYSIYKLQKKITLKDDVGRRTTYSWDNYNIQADSLLPYSCSTTTWLEQSIIAGYNKNVDINVQVRDQFHIGLRDVYVNFYKSGDFDALFDPLSGAVTTDLNGKATINYRSGVTYTGHTLISAKATGASLSTGSGYTWTANNIISYPNTNPTVRLMFQLKSLNSIYGNLKQLWDNYRKIWIKSPIEIYWEYPDISIFCKSFFTSPGGDWGDKTNVDYGKYYLGFYEVAEYLPMLYRGKYQTDTPPHFSAGFGFHNWPYVLPTPEAPFFIGNQIRLLEDFTSTNKIKSLTEYLIYRIVGNDLEGIVPYIIIKQPDETGKLQISQLKLSLHTHWVDGKAYDELFTRVKINQFIFVEDAVPKFWSEKNPTDTNIWIRLRPFAFSLNNSTFRMWVRERSYLGDTGYYEVTESVSLLNFDAGGGMLGIEALYNPPKDFLYGSLIFVRIEVYDQAYIPNFIYTEYWFKVTPDYKAPYLYNLKPDREEVDVSVDTTIHFEIIDVGTGIDIESLECLLNSVRMNPEYLKMEIVSVHHIKLDYKPPDNLFFSKDYKVSIKVQDTSPNKNRANDSYRFYTADSTGVLIIDPSPGVCKSAMRRFQDVSVKVLADGNGVDVSSIRMQVFNKDVHPRLLPIIYRIA